MNDYPNKIKMKMKASDFKNVQDGMSKAYKEFAKENRTFYGNVEYIIKGNQPDGRFSWTSDDEILDISFEIKYVHYDTKEEIPAETLRNYKEKSESIAKDFVRREINGKNFSDVEKVLKINNFLSEKAEYNHESIKLGRYLLEDHIAYGVLVDGIGVCESYAKAFDLLANQAGLETVYVTGYGKNSASSKGEDHAWNMVKIDGEWYNIDTTWNDTENGVRYDYFLKPDSIMNTTHQRDKEYSYPDANGSKDFVEELGLKN